MAAYYYSSSAGEMRLVGAVTNVVGSVTVDSAVGLPASVPFKVVVDPGLAVEEILKVHAVAGDTLTVTRGWDGSLANAHSNGAVVRHMVTAEDLRLSREHEEATDAHGVVGLVGLANVQTLTNKTFQATGAETPLKVQQSGTSTSDLVQVLTAGGSIRAKLTTLGLYLRTASANVAEFLTGDGETASAFIARLTPSLVSSDGLRIAMPASSVGKALTVSLNAAEKAYIEADGDATVQALTATSVTSSGPVAGTTGSFSGAVSGASSSVSGNATVGGNATVSGNLAVTGDITVDDVTGDVGTFASLVTTNLISAPGLKAVGTEGQPGPSAGPAAPAGTPLLFKFFSQVVLTNSAGGFSVTFPGGAFPTGTTTVVPMSGDNNADQAAVRLIATQVSPAGFGGQVLTAGGVGVNAQNVRINGFAVGY